MPQNRTKGKPMLPPILTTPIGPDLPAPITILSLLALMLWEAWLGSTARVDANSTIGLLAGVVTRMLRRGAKVAPSSIEVQ
jgi:hypothetical protein